MPSPRAKANTIQSVTTPVRVTAAIPSPRMAMEIWVSISSVRRSIRSATSPVTGSRSSCGPNWRAIVTPTAVASSSVSSVRTSQSWAMRCIQVPTFETTAPANHRR